MRAAQAGFSVRRDEGTVLERAAYSTQFNSAFGGIKRLEDRPGTCPGEDHAGVLEYAGMSERADRRVHAL